MKGRQKIKKYAKIFFNSTDIEMVPEAIGQLSTISGLMSRSKEFKGLFDNPSFTPGEREKIMKELSDRFKLSDSTTRLIMLLSEDRMILSLPELIDTIIKIYLEKKKRAKAMVVTSIDTKNKFDDRLLSSLKKITGRDVDIEYVIDRSLLGGMLIKVGSTMYDSSIKGQFRLLKDELLKER